MMAGTTAYATFYNSLNPSRFFKYEFEIPTRKIGTTTIRKVAVKKSDNTFREAKVNPNLM
jgi:hypothetical protein